MDHLVAPRGISCRPNGSNACLIFAFKMCVHCESIVYRSFRSEVGSARGVSKVTTGIIGSKALVAKMGAMLAWFWFAVLFRLKMWTSIGRHCNYDGWKCEGQLEDIIIITAAENMCTCWKTWWWHWLKLFSKCSASVCSTVAFVRGLWERPLWRRLQESLAQVSLTQASSWKRLRNHLRFFFICFLHTRFRV